MTRKSYAVGCGLGDQVMKSPAGTANHKDQQDRIIHLPSVSDEVRASPRSPEDGESLELTFSVERRPSFGMNRGHLEQLKREATATYPYVEILLY